MPWANLKCRELRGLVEKFEGYRQPRHWILIKALEEDERTQFVRGRWVGLQNVHHFLDMLWGKMTLGNASSFLEGSIEIHH